MPLLTTAARLIAILIGVLAVVSGLADVLGFIPHSNEMPTWTRRLVSSLPAIIAGAVLLLPMRKFTRGVAYAALQLAYVAVTVVAAAKVVEGIIGYIEGRLHWAVLPTSLFLAAVVSGNAFLLWYFHRKSMFPPNNCLEGDALKPTRASG